MNTYRAVHYRYDELTQSETELVEIFEAEDDFAAVEEAEKALGRWNPPHLIERVAP